MRASEAEQRICPFSFSIGEIPGVREPGPWQCQTDRCMAWRVSIKKGDEIVVGDKTLLPNGYEEAPRHNDLRRARAIEDHGDCFALRQPEL